MGIIGSIIGGIIGGVTLGPWGAFAGAAIGAGVGNKNQDTHSHNYGYCPTCNTKLTFPSDEGIFKCNHCNSAVILINCPHCSAGLITNDIGKVKCSTCDSTFTIGVCDNCGELYTFKNKSSIRKKCKSCGGKIITKGQQDENTELFSITIGVVMLGMEIAASDGHIDDVEINQIKSFFTSTGMDAKGMNVIDGLINKYYEEQPQINNIIKELNSIMKKDDKLMLIDFLFRIAAADGIVEDSEINKIKYFSDKLRLSQSDFEMLSNRYSAFKKGAKSNSDISYYCNILNVSVDSDFEEVKKSYRELCKKYHPDKFMSMGEEFAEIATVKFQEIQAAYEELKKYHNA